MLVPESVGKAFVVDCSPALGLYVTYNNDNGVAVWDPESRKVIAIFKDIDGNFCDALFLPGDRLAVSSSGLKQKLVSPCKRFMVTCY